MGAILSLWLEENAGSRMLVGSHRLGTGDKFSSFPVASRKTRKTCNVVM